LLIVSLKVRRGRVVRDREVSRRKVSDEAGCDKQMVPACDHGW